MASAGVANLEWLMCMVCEAFGGKFNLKDRFPVLRSIPSIVISDAKSLYDHLISPNAPLSLEDKRCAVEMVILNESMVQLGTKARWTPTEQSVS